MDAPRKSRKERLAEERAQKAEADAPGKPTAKGSKGKAKAGKDEKKPKGVLLEATPESETYAARRGGRMLIGGVMFLGVGHRRLMMSNT